MKKESFLINTAEQVEYYKGASKDALFVLAKIICNENEPKPKARRIFTTFCCNPEGATSVHIRESEFGFTNYAKRQMTWFKQDKRIKWISRYKEAEKLVNNFLK